MTNERTRSYRTPEQEEMEDIQKNISRTTLRLRSAADRFSNSFSKLEYEQAKQAIADLTVELARMKELAR